jgi:hypothetical protein
MSHPPPGPQPPTIPEPIHRDEASQVDVDQRLAAHAEAARERRAANAPGPERITALLEQIAYGQERLLDLQSEQTRLLQAILQAVSGQGA